LDNKLQIEEKQQKSAQNSRKLLKECFSEVNCFLMPKLGERSDEPDFDGSVGQLSEEFVRKLKEMITTLLNPEEITAKTVNDKTITGNEFCQLMESLVNVFNTSEFEKPDSKELLMAYSRVSDIFNLRHHKVITFLYYHIKLIFSMFSDLS
jgi:atlastin